MQCNLFIIISVNVIGVSTDTFYSHTCLGADIWGVFTKQIDAEGSHEEGTKSYR